jgi:predicted ferric reductase
MSTNSTTAKFPVLDKGMVKILRAFSGFAVLGVFLMIVFGFALYLSTPISTSLRTSLQSIFQLDSVQMWWYVTRSAGLTGYFLIWLSMVWGFAVSSKIFQFMIDGSHSYDFHEHLSLLGLAFVALHVIVLLLDRFLPFSIIQVLVPFTESYRPLWVGIGIISMYVMVLVTVTFYLRKQIGMAAFRFIHILSIFSYLGATLHGLFAGTDSALLVTKLLYLGTFLIILFMTIYWVILNIIATQEKLEAEKALALRKAIQRNQARQRKPA